MKRLVLEGFGHPQVAYGFFTRQGGVSKGIYASLNCSPQSSDNLGHVAQNRARVVEALGGGDLSTLKQIHSAECHLIARDCTHGFEEGDALVTKTPGQIVGVLTADCGPVLFAGEDSDGNPVIGAAHAGWGGALKGVLESTIHEMVNQGAIKETIHAAVGPCIAQPSYEVSVEFREPFMAEDKVAADYFRAGKHGKLHFDMPGYITYRLRRAGVTHIAHANHDTYAMEDDYFSFRRATHRGQNDYGRQISAICVRSS